MDQTPAAPQADGQPVRWLVWWLIDDKPHEAIFDDYGRAEHYAVRNHGIVLPLIVHSQPVTT